MLVHPRLFGSFALAALLAIAAPRAQAQCGPDGLTGPCCGLTFANIPAIPALQLDCRWICFNGCNVSQQFVDCVNLGPHVPAMSSGGVQCGVYDLRFRVKTCGTTTFLWNGVLKAFYSRTWEEFPVLGAPPIQVWRFIVNGDLLPTAALPTGICRKPACTSNYTRVYFSGHMDYAFNCSTGGWSVAFAISHECDAIHHPPGSARPAPGSGLHATRSFSIVGPGTGFAAASTGPRSDGPITADAIRWNSWAPAPGAPCTFEEDGITGGFLATNDFCFCTTAGPLQYANTQVFAQGPVGACGNSVSPDSGGTLFFQKRIGGWTNPAVFPGVEFALFDFGYLRFSNGCNATNTREWFEGGETIGGYVAASLTGVVLDPEFEDLGSSNNSKTNPAIRIGAPHVSNYILNFNLP
ncbi:MAG: hypothetical protein ACKVXR_02915 [Planctomycetota bacterium]